MGGRTSNELKTVLKFKLANTDLQVKFQKAVVSQMLNKGKSHYPNEFGGILIGRYDEIRKVAYIHYIVNPKHFKASPAFFQRETKGLEQKLIDLHKQTPSLYYLGEWHTHPNGSTSPSTTDINTLITLSKSEQVSIDNPLMLIIGLSPSKINFGLYIYLDQKIQKYEQQH